MDQIQYRSIFHDVVRSDGFQNLGNNLVASYNANYPVELHGIMILYLVLDFRSNLSEPSYTSGNFPLKLLELWLCISNFFYNIWSGRCYFSYKMESIPSKLFSFVKAWFFPFIIIKLNHFRVDQLFSYDTNTGKQVKQNL